MINRMKFSCEMCLVKALSTITRDQTAISDVKRAHVAYRRGWDRTRVAGQYILVPFAKFEAGITYAQSVAWCDSMLEAGMKPTTLNVYRSTFDRAWQVVDCAHGSAAPSTANAADFGVGLGQPAVPSSPNLSNPKGAGAGNTSRPTWSSSGDDGGLRLSVAQKNLSLILKWSWINGLISTPPVCPVDRIMLDRASRITGQTWSVNWTRVNSLNEWDEHFALLLNAAKGMPIAEWEIIQFEGGADETESHRDRQMRDILNQLLGTNSSEPSADSHDKKVNDAKLSFMARFGKGGPGHDEWPYDMLTDALKSALQHNPTYKDTTREEVRSEIRETIKRLGLNFLKRWHDLQQVEQSVDRFRLEIVDFRDELNSLYRPYFR